MIEFKEDERMKGKTNVYYIISGTTIEVTKRCKICNSREITIETKDIRKPKKNNY